jgi:hypothetical protein
MNLIVVNVGCDMFWAEAVTLVKLFERQKPRVLFHIVLVVPILSSG